MKKILFAISVISFYFLISCSNTGSSSSSGMSEKAKKNLETARAIAKTFETKDISKLDDYIAADVVDHASPGGETKGLDNEKKMFSDMQGTMSDSKMENVKEIADDDYVFQWMKESWTQTKESMGMKPGSYSLNMIEVSKFNADSKVTEHWSFMDVNDMMKMMPSGMGNMMMDSTHKDTSKMKM
jgi:predicted SnoaL-like aldol condensation-catalyzing enzyme